MMLVVHGWYSKFHNMCILRLIRIYPERDTVEWYYKATMRTAANYQT